MTTTYKPNNKVGRNLQQLSHSLVYGYIRACIKGNAHLCKVFSFDLFDLIFQFYPTTYKVIGVGELKDFNVNVDVEDDGDTNTNTNTDTNRTNLNLRELAELSEYCDDLSHLYHGNGRIIFRTTHNRIFYIGDCAQQQNMDGCCTQMNVDGGGGSMFEIDVPSVLALRTVDSDHNSAHTNDDEDDDICLISDGFGRSHTFLVSKRGRIFASGRNKSGQLGLNHSQQDRITAEVSMRDDNNNNIKMRPSFARFGGIKHIGCGLHGTVFLTHHGLLFRCGKFKGDVGRSFERWSCITRIETELRLHTICVGYFQVVGIASSPSSLLCVWGSSSSIFGISADTNTIKTPMVHPFFKNMEMVKAKCSRNHSFCISKTGQCFLFGFNGDGRLGCAEDTENQCKGIHHLQGSGCVLEHRGIADVSLGDGHSLILTEDNEVYSCGNNAQGCCSVWNRAESIKRPHHLSREELGLPAKQRIVKVFAAGDTSLIFTL